MHFKIEIWELGITFPSLSGFSFSQNQSYEWESKSCYKKSTAKPLILSLSHPQQEARIGLSSCSERPWPFVGDLENNVENQQYVVEIKSLKRYFSCKDNVAENISFLPSKDAHEKKKKRGENERYRREKDIQWYQPLATQCPWTLITKPHSSSTK